MRHKDWIVPCFFALFAVGCADYSAQFDVDSVDVSIVGCSLDEGDALREKYVPFDESSPISVDYDPITYVMVICTVNDDEFGATPDMKWCLKTDGGNWNDQTHVSGTVVDDTGASSAFDESVTADVRASFDAISRTMVLKGGASRVRTCSGDCGGSPKQVCTVTVNVRATTSDDISFLDAF